MIIFRKEFTENLNSGIVTNMCNDIIVTNMCNDIKRRDHRKTIERVSTRVVVVVVVVVAQPDCLPTLVRMPQA